MSSKKVEETNLIITDLTSVRIAVDLEIEELIGDGVALLFVDLEHWFEQYPKGFARHCEPRKDQLKLGGMSFTEELNLTRYKVKKGLKMLCLCYESREDFDSAEDKFQGKYYCSVYEPTNRRRTFYYRNHMKFAELKGQWEQRFVSSGPSRNQDLGVKE